MAAKNIADVEVLSESFAWVRLLHCRIGREPTARTALTACKNVGGVEVMPDERIIIGTSQYPGLDERWAGESAVSGQATGAVSCDHQAGNLGAGSNWALVAVIALELTFSMLAQCVQHLNYIQGLQELVGPTALGVAVIHGKAIMLAIGRRVMAACAVGRGIG